MRDRVTHGVAEVFLLARCRLLLVNRPGPLIPAFGDLTLEPLLRVTLGGFGRHVPLLDVLGYVRRDLQSEGFLGQVYVGFNPGVERLEVAFSQCRTEI